MLTIITLLILCLILVNCNQKHGTNLSLWIDAEQVRNFTGYPMGNAFVIEEGEVSPYVLDPNFENNLPNIPPHVSSVNFTWKSGPHKYKYIFDQLQSFDESILDTPHISIRTEGRIPRRDKVFSVFLPCSGKRSGIALFAIGLIIKSKGKPLRGTPIRLKLMKECAPRGIFPGPDPECDKKCANGGWCNRDKICMCPKGYLGQYCKTALCYPPCMNGGNCTAPGVCTCPDGYQGRQCEGGICRDKCQNGGKCIQKDTCECTKGFYGLRCEFTRCVIPCLNGGKCKGTNKCRCHDGFKGDHCEIRMAQQRQMCSRPCRHGKCQPDDTCSCESGWTGLLCQHRLMVSKRDKT